MQKGIIKKVSNQNFDTTYQKLVDKIAGDPELKLIAELDHSSGAKEAGLDLRPMKVIMFRGPLTGALLIQDSLTAGLDLPQKILVYQNDVGIVNVAYNNPSFLKERHDISNGKTELDGISHLLESITNEATL